MIILLPSKRDQTLRDPKLWLKQLDCGDFCFIIAKYYFYDLTTAYSVGSDYSTE